MTTKIPNKSDKQKQQPLQLSMVYECYCNVAITGHIRACIHRYVHTYINACINTYTHTHTHTHKYISGTDKLKYKA